MMVEEGGEVFRCFARVAQRHAQVGRRLAHHIIAGVFLQRTEIVLQSGILPAFLQVLFGSLEASADVRHRKKFRVVLGGGSCTSCARASGPLARGYCMHKHCPEQLHIRLTSVPRPETRVPSALVGFRDSRPGTRDCSATIP